MEMGRALLGQTGKQDTPTHAHAHNTHFAFALRTHGFGTGTVVRQGSLRGMAASSPLYLFCLFILSLLCLFSDALLLCAPSTRFYTCPTFITTHLLPAFSLLSHAYPLLMCVPFCTPPHLCVLGQIVACLLRCRLLFVHARDDARDACFTWHFLRGIAWHARAWRACRTRAGIQRNDACARARDRHHFY